MAIQIIKQGTAPEDKKHEVTCTTCHTVFSFLTSDAKREGDQRDGDYLVIDCPTCQRRVTKSV